jgi:hypothetical protein
MHWNSTKLHNTTAQHTSHYILTITTQHSITLPEIRTRTHKFSVNTRNLRSTNSVILVSGLNIVQHHK